MSANIFYRPVDQENKKRGDEYNERASQEYSRYQRRVDAFNKLPLYKRLFIKSPILTTEVLWPEKQKSIEDYLDWLNDTTPTK